jgi:phosphonoacetate hydrolase
LVIRAESSEWLGICFPKSAARESLGALIMDAHAQAVSFSVNGRRYQCPGRAIVAICLDGSADEYLNAALLRGLMPNLQKICLAGVRGIARAAMPTFTNVNNASIVTGVPPAMHGICGNYFYDSQARREVMMNSAEFLRTPTIFPAAAHAGRKVAVVTAKEKLRDIFAHNLIAQGGIAFSSEKAGQARKDTHGISGVEELVGEKTPAIYSGDASLYVLRAGVALLREERADFLYLSTTDYIQHKAAPDERTALDFYALIDVELGKLSALGALIGITADHGMNAKQKPDGTPNVIYLESVLKENFGGDLRVILPITDPYVAHHGALGSFAVVHTSDDVPVPKVREFLLKLSGVTEVYFKNEAAAKLQLPLDRIGELIVCAGRDTTLGRTPEYHDLSALPSGLRSHGGRYEEMVPLILSEPVNAEYRAKMRCDPRNFDLFDFIINGTSA